MSDNDPLTEKLKDSIGKDCIIFTLNRFRYECRILKIYGDFLEIFDTKKSFEKILRISDIAEVDFL